MPTLVRHAHHGLERWIDGPRRKPLVIRGARQVGKSTLVRQFATSRKLRLLEVNLERHRDLEPVFASLDVGAILVELEAVGRLAPGPDVLIFLDEIQATPSALAVLRYLHEERPDLRIVAAGSLLEMVLQSPDFSMPVGRIEYLHLGPLSFTEYLQAMGEDDLVGLAARWTPGAPWAGAAHDRLATRQREFLFVGGMPEAVAAHAAGEGHEAVRRVHASIVDTYRDDFSEYGSTPNVLARLRTVFDYLPGAVGQKIKYANIARDQSSRDLRAALDLLALARVVWRVHHSDASGLPLEARIDPHVFKCLMLDVGLVSHVTGVSLAALGRWEDRRLVHEGGLAEQFVGQHLLFRRPAYETPSLCYWLREGKRNNAEVDFVIAHGRTLVPVEVKAGAAGRLRSVHQFLARNVKHASNLLLRFDMNPPSVSDHAHQLPGGGEVRYRMLSLPLYLVGECERLLDEVLEVRHG